LALDKGWKLCRGLFSYFFFFFAVVFFFPAAFFFFIGIAMSPPLGL
jgi:hypothetical protein